MEKLGIIILAAGLGKRMKSQMPKVLHNLCGRPLISYSLETALSLEPEKCCVVLGYKNEMVKPFIPENVGIVIQDQQLGTGDAVKKTVDYFQGFDGNILVLCGDVPLLKTAALRKLVNMMNTPETAAVILTTIIDNPAGYGRIIRNEENIITAIIEEKDADSKTKAIKEINSGIYCFNSKLLYKYIQQLTNENSQGEYYLTDVIGILSAKKSRIAGHIIPNPADVEGINDRRQLSAIEKEMYLTIAHKHLEKGVIIIDPYATFIDINSRICAETVIYPRTEISNSIIGKNCEIKNSIISECEIKDNVKILGSTIEKSIINSNAEIGFFNFISETEIKNDSKILTHNILRNSIFGAELSIQSNCSLIMIEAGKKCVFSNNVAVSFFDGLNEHKTTIGDEVFICAGCNLAAPVIIEDKAYITAGSTILKDVKKDSFVINSPQLSVKPGYFEKIKKKIEGGEE